MACSIDKACSLKQPLNFRNFKAIEFVFRPNIQVPPDALTFFLKRPLSCEFALHASYSHQFQEILSFKVEY